MLKKAQFSHAQKNYLLKGGRVSFLCLKNMEVIVFPKAQRTVRVNETNNDLRLFLQISRGGYKVSYSMHNSTILTF